MRVSIHIDHSQSRIDDVHAEIRIHDLAERRRTSNLVYRLSPCSSAIAFGKSIYFQVHVAVEVLIKGL